ASIATMVLHFVDAGLVEPDLAGPVQVAASHPADFAGPHGRQPLNLDHSPNLPGEVGLQGIDPRIRDRLDRFSFLGLGLPLTQSCDGFQGLVYTWSNQLLGHGPPEKAHDFANSEVNRVPGEPRVDHVLADGFEAFRGETCGRVAAVETLEGSERIDKVV